MRGLCRIAIRFGIMILFAIFLTGCGMNNLHETTVEGTVVDIQYQEAYQTYTVSTLFEEEPCFLKIEHSESFLVLIIYEDLYVTVDDKTLYDSVDIGEKVEVILREWDDYADNPQRDIVWK